jgi:hypothetical protein
MVKERLRLFLEKQGVVLPTQPDELKDVIKENPHLKDEILLWATLQFGLPFADTETLNLNPILEMRCKQGMRSGYKTGSWHANPLIQHANNPLIQSAKKG